MTNPVPEPAPRIIFARPLSSTRDFYEISLEYPYNVGKLRKDHKCTRVFGLRGPATPMSDRQILESNDAVELALE